MEVFGEHYKNLTAKMKHENWTEHIPYYKDVSATLRKHDLSKNIVNNLDEETLLLVLASTAVAMLVCVFFFLLCWLCGKTGKKLNHVMLLGPEDSGKTRLFLCLTNNSNHQLTCTSLTENCASVKLGKKDVTLVDVPGNGRIIWPIFDKFKGSCGRILFLVDSCAVFKNQRAQTGEYLFSILTDPFIAKLKPIINIVCTKQDAPMAKSTTLVKQVLEAELTTLKKTSRATLGDIADSRDSSGRSKRAAVLAEGKHGNVDLSLMPYKVQFVESSISKSDPNSLDFDMSLFK